MNEVRQLGRGELVSWVNSFLDCAYDSVEAFKDGVAFVSLLDAVFPGKVPLERVHFGTSPASFHPIPAHARAHRLTNTQNKKQKAACENEALRKKNFRLLDSLFGRLGLRRELDVPRLVEGNFAATYDLLQWGVAMVRSMRPAVARPDGTRPTERYPAWERRQEALRARRASPAALPPHLCPHEPVELEHADSFRRLPDAGAQAAAPALIRQGSLPSSSAMMAGGEEAVLEMEDLDAEEADTGAGEDDDEPEPERAASPRPPRRPHSRADAIGSDADTAGSDPGAGRHPNPSAAAVYERSRELEDLIESLESDVRARLARQRERLAYVARLARSRELYFDMLLHIEGACETFGPSPLRDRLTEALEHSSSPLFSASPGAGGAGE